MVLIFNLYFDSKGPQAPSLSNLTQHAIIVSNSKYYGQEPKQCIKDREALRMALLKAGWHFGMFLYIHFLDFMS